MDGSERLTRKKLTASLTGRGTKATDYTSDATKQALTIRLSEYENTGLNPEEIEAAKGDPSQRPTLEASEMDVLEAYNTGRMICPQCCATCGHYPENYPQSAICTATGRVVRKLQYCSAWIIGRSCHHE